MTHLSDLLSVFLAMDISVLTLFTPFLHLTHLSHFSHITPQVDYEDLEDLLREATITSRRINGRVFYNGIFNDCRLFLW
jgi:hypothetical protein